MYEIIKVGIPLQTKDITDEFLNIVKDIQSSKECLAVTTVDYWQGEINYAPGGNYFLLNNLEFKPYIDTLCLNCVNTLGSMWGVVRDIPSLVDNMLTMFDDEHKRLKFKRVYIFAGGSPLCGDSITDVLLKKCDIKIVDTKSCIQVAIDHLNIKSAYTDVDFVYDYIKKGNKYIDTSKVNVFLCLQKWYEYDNVHTLKTFFHEMKKYYNTDDIFQTVNITSETCETFKTTFGDAENYVDDIYNDHRAFIVLLHKKDLK
jgi:hypothetical protein